MRRREPEVRGPEEHELAGALFRRDSWARLSFAGWWTITVVRQIAETLGSRYADGLPTEAARHAKKRAYALTSFGGQVGGEGGIRTHGTLARTTVFEDVKYRAKLLILLDKINVYETLYESHFTSGR